MGALDNGFRLNPDSQPLDGDVLVYDAATDSLRPGGGVPGAIGVTSVDAYSTAGGSVEAGTSLGAGATEIAATCRAVFVAPSSGRVLVRMTAWVEAPASGDYYWYPRIVVDSTNAEQNKVGIKVAQVDANAPRTKQYINVERLISSLASGTTYRVEWQHAATVAGWIIKPDSSDNRQMVLSVTSLGAAGPY